MKEIISSRAIPTTTLLIKDHTPTDTQGNFPTRLVVPATNFTAGFPKIGYLGIKRIIDEAGVKYARKTIVQACDLKSTLEKLDLKRNKSTIMSLYIKDMYPYIRYKVVERAIFYFARNLGEEKKLQIRRCLELIKFGIGNTLLTF